MLISGRAITNNYVLPKNENQKNAMEESKSQASRSQALQDQDALMPDAVAMMPQNKRKDHLSNSTQISVNKALAAQNPKDS